MPVVRNFLLKQINVLANVHTIVGMALVITLTVGKNVGMNV